MLSYAPPVDCSVPFMCYLMLTMHGLPLYRSLPHAYVDRLSSSYWYRTHVRNLATDTRRLCGCHLLGHFGLYSVVAETCSSSHGRSTTCIVRPLFADCCDDLWKHDCVCSGAPSHPSLGSGERLAASSRVCHGMVSRPCNTSHFVFFPRAGRAEARIHSRNALVQ